MDENLIKDSLTGFDAVWTRVTGMGQTPPAETVYSEDETLKQLIYDEICAAQCAAALARMFQGDGRAVLLRHAADAKRRSRRLRAEYFIRTGLTCEPPDNCRGASGKLASLRAALLQANQRAERYAQAAERSDSPELRQVYRTFAADAIQHAQETRALLIDSF